jgi:hypothetical protein
MVDHRTKEVPLGIAEVPASSSWPFGAGTIA